MLLEPAVKASMTQKNRELAQAVGRFLLSPNVRLRRKQVNGGELAPRPHNCLSTRGKRISGRGPPSERPTSAAMIMNDFLPLPQLAIAARAHETKSEEGDEETLETSYCGVITEEEQGGAPGCIVWWESAGSQWLVRCSGE